MNFKQLHGQATPLLIGNVWDVISAKAAQKTGYQVMGTSSGAIAAMLGYRDGEEISFSELAYIVQRILKSVDLPLTVDLEAGYSRNPVKIAEHVMRLVDLGIVGVNLEDSLVNGTRKLVDSSAFSRTLETVCSHLIRHNCKVFMNVRTDTFLLGVQNPLEETIRRAGQYVSAGGQGLFVPCIVKEADIKSVVQGIELPLNVMCMPDLPDFDVLGEVGVSRISVGNFVHNKLNANLEDYLLSITQDGSFKKILA